VFGIHLCADVQRVIDFRLRNSIGPYQPCNDGNTGTKPGVLDACSLDTPTFAFMRNATTNQSMGRHR
jgi:hypothetical protein